MAAKDCTEAQTFFVPVQFAWFLIFVPTIFSATACVNKFFLKSCPKIFGIKVKRVSPRKVPNLTVLTVFCKQYFLSGLSQKGAYLKVVNFGCFFWRFYLPDKLSETWTKSCRKQKKNFQQPLKQHFETTQYFSIGLIWLAPVKPDLISNIMNLAYVLPNELYYDLRHKIFGYLQILEKFQN